MMASALPRVPRWRWPVAAAAVLGLHAAALVMLRDRQPVSPAAQMPEPAILLELAPAAPEPVPAAAAQPPAPLEPPPPEPAPPEPVPPQPAPVQPPSPEPAPPAPSPPETVQPAPPAVIPDQADTTMPPPKPRAVPVPHRAPASLKPRPAPARPVPSTQAAAEQPAPPAPARAEAAPAPASPGQEAATWAGRLAAHLLRFRHYPPEAERRGFTGVVTMRFSVDASGHILAQSMIHSSGHDALDEEAAAWLARAQPLPVPPPDRVAPAQIVVPLAFVLH